MHSLRELSKVKNFRRRKKRVKQLFRDKEKRYNMHMAIGEKGQKNIIMLLPIFFIVDKKNMYCYIISPKIYVPKIVFLFFSFYLIIPRITAHKLPHFFSGISKKIYFPSR